MRLKRLWVDGFKNLNDFEIDFNDKDGITVLIGNNGSGKSNVLEAISAIFTALYKFSTPQRKPKFEYEIEYNLNDDEYKLELKKYKDEYRYSFLKNGKKTLIKNIKNNPSNYLPSQIIAIYSGEETRLWDDYYKYSYDDFMNLVKSNELRTLPPYRLFYIDKDYWNEALLVLLFSELEGNKKFIKEKLKISQVDKIEFYFNKKNIESFPENIIVDFVKKINPDTEKKLTFSLDDFKKLVDGEYEKGLFIKLISATLSKLISDIVITFNTNLTVSSLSEGEKKQILVRIALEVVADENSLILMDEPDANIHVANKVQIKEMLEEYENRENILTTHSPTLTHTFDEKHICMLIDGKVEDKNKQEVFAEISDGIWSYQEQNIFLASKKDIILLVEGKHDKIHIEEAFKRLKSEYKDLEFDIFAVNGADNIKQLLIGIKSSFNMFDKNKKYIGIFDCDDKGKEIVGKNARSKKFSSLGNSKNFYYMYLPFYDYEQSFEIENMYPENKLHLAYKEAVNLTTTNINKNSIEKEAKNQLSIMCKDFDDEDFEHFKKLFDLIMQIKAK